VSEWRSQPDRSKSHERLRTDRIHWPGRNVWPVSYLMSEVAAASASSSGYSGTCTVAYTHTGGMRVKADGRGVAYSLVEFNVVDLSDPLLLRTTEYVDVNQQGTFRTNWQSVDAGVFPAGHDLQCRLANTVTGNVLASSETFPAR
jgi:hypothetical protein